MNIEKNFTDNWMSHKNEVLKKVELIYLSMKKIGQVELSFNKLLVFVLLDNPELDVGLIVPYIKEEQVLSRLEKEGYTNMKKSLQKLWKKRKKVFRERYKNETNTWKTRKKLLKANSYKQTRELHYMAEEILNGVVHTNSIKGRKRLFLKDNVGPYIQQDDRQWYSGKWKGTENHVCIDILLTHKELKNYKKNFEKEHISSGGEWLKRMDNLWHLRKNLERRSWKYCKVGDRPSKLYEKIDGHWKRISKRHLFSKDLKKAFYLFTGKKHKDVEKYFNSEKLKQRVKGIRKSNEETIYDVEKELFKLF